MAKTPKGFLLDALQDLSDTDLKKFRNRLIDRSEEPRVRRSAVQHADYMDLADKMVETFTENYVIKVTVELLRAIDCNNTADELESKILTGVPPPDPPPNQPTSSGLIHCSDGFFKEKQKSMKVYPVIDRSTRKRLALLITNIEFECDSMYRAGADEDEKNMENLFEQMGYSVKKARNLYAQEIDVAVKEFSQLPDLSQTDSVFVVIMSHGKLGKVCGVGWKESDPPGSRDEFPIDNIYKHLNTQNCPALKDKPKVIIIQACRGEKEGFVRDGPLNSDDASQPADEGRFVEDALRRVHVEKDFISLLSCTPDHVSYRHSKKGSFLIQFIDEIFKKHSHDQHIENLFTMVMNRFEEYDAVTQMPTKDRCTLTKHFYLFPGH